MARFSTSLAAILIGMAASQALAQNGFEPVTRDVLANPPPGDWLMINRTYDEQRFSPLDQINKSNVANLRMVWSRGLPAGTAGVDAHRVDNGVMYLIAPGGGVQALDATNGDLIWEYFRDTPQDLGAVDPRRARRARQEPRDLRGHGLLRRARRLPRRARCADRQGCAGRRRRTTTRTGPSTPAA